MRKYGGEAQGDVVISWENEAYLLEPVHGRGATPTPGQPLELDVQRHTLAQQFRELVFKEGETMVVSPREARVFLQPA